MPAILSHDRSYAAVLFIADMFPSTRQQIEQNAEQVIQQVEHAERRATAAEQQVDRSLKQGRD